MAENEDANVPATAASGTGVVLSELGEIPFDLTESSVFKAHFIPTTAQAQQAAPNFAQLQIRDVTQANKVLATLDYSVAPALVAEQAQDFVLGASLSVKQGDVLDVYLNQNGTGGASPAGRVELEVE